MAQQIFPLCCHSFRNDEIAGVLTFPAGRAKELQIQKANRDYLGVADAETITGVSRWTWRRWAYDGKVASVKLGKRLLIPRSEIDRLITENMRPARPQ